jgi:hypothetical protein
MLPLSIGLANPAMLRGLNVNAYSAGILSHLKPRVLADTLGLP